MADEALFLLLHNEMVSGVYKSAEQGEVHSMAGPRGADGDGAAHHPHLQRSPRRPETQARLYEQVCR
uniref:Trafficking protein particle complex 6B n=1 Tax=Mus musculus TaxID=10090 RepID=A0A1W2P7N0_MOUSE